MRAAPLALAALALVVVAAGGEPAYDGSGSTLSGAVQREDQASAPQPPTSLQTGTAGSHPGGSTKPDPAARKLEQLTEFVKEDEFKNYLALFWMPDSWRAALPHVVQVGQACCIGPLGACCPGPVGACCGPLLWPRGPWAGTGAGGLAPAPSHGPLHAATRSTPRSLGARRAGCGTGLWFNCCTTAWAWSGSITPTTPLARTCSSPARSPTGGPCWSR